MGATAPPDSLSMKVKSARDEQRPPKEGGWG